LRRIAEALYALVNDVIGLEGFLVVAGLAGLTLVAWDADWRIGVAVASISAIAIGVGLVSLAGRPRPPGTP
jgi:hypothetical protein